jgi:hypothetical protein
MNTTIEKYRHLSVRLYERTIAKGIRWQHDAKSNTVEAKIGQQFVTVKQTINSDFEFLYVVSIENSSSVYLDGFNDEQLGKEIAPVEKTMSYYSLMENLYEMAKRQATGADVALDQVLATLDQEEEDDVPF